jgi:hypothetical protein
MHPVLALSMLAPVGLFFDIAPACHSFYEEGDRFHVLIDLLSGKR